MAFINPGTPNLEDFTTYVYGQGVPVIDLPLSSEFLVWAFNHANDRTMTGPIGLMPSGAYVIAVYNLGMHQLLKIAIDESGQTFFTNSRKQFNLLSFTGGVVQTASDQSTSTTVAVPDLLKNLSLSDLDLLKTPWGRDYAAYSMNYGKYVVGVS